jgi:esterase/lipase
MLIHGAWLSSRSWDPFAEYFRERGYDVSAPEWPRKQGDVEELREATEAIEGLGLTEIVDHYEAQIRALDREPILIGHSFGGLRRAPAGSGARPRGRRDEPCAAEGDPRPAFLNAQGRLDGTGT